MTMFFVLSGFILSHAYESASINLKSYFWNRFARIYPVYLLAAILALPWLLKEAVGGDISSSPLASFVGLIILIIWGLFLIQAWLPQTFSFWNNSASWSISNEAFFYSLFPSLSKFIKNMSIKFLVLNFLLLCILSTMIPASSIVFSQSPEEQSLFYALPAYRVLEFICGIIAFYIMKKVSWGPFLKAILLIVCALGILHVAILGDELPGYTLHNWIFIPTVASLLILLYQGEIRGSTLFGGKVFVWLGQISYCFYSFQFHVLEGLRYALPMDKVHPWIFALLAAGLLIIVSALAHHFFEEPARVWIRRRVARVNSKKSIVT